MKADGTEPRVSYDEVRDDYHHDGGIFSEDSETVSRIKWVLDNLLSEAERKVFILHAEGETVRRIGAAFGKSQQWASTEVRRIRKKIITEYQKLTRK